MMRRATTRRSSDSSCCRRSWADAEEACQEMGSQTHLASVTSEEQQRAVVHLAATTDFIWIGLNDMTEEGSFVWSDDERWEYTATLTQMTSRSAGKLIVTSAAMASRWPNRPIIGGRMSQCPDSGLTSAPRRPRPRSPVVAICSAVRAGTG